MVVLHSDSSPRRLPPACLPGLPLAGRLLPFPFERCRGACPVVRPQVRSLLAQVVVPPQPGDTGQSPSSARTSPPSPSVLPADRPSPWRASPWSSARSAFTAPGGGAATHSTSSPIPCRPLSKGLIILSLGNCRRLICIYPQFLPVIPADAVDGGDGHIDRQCAERRQHHEDDCHTHVGRDTPGEAAELPVRPILRLCDDFLIISRQRLRVCKSLFSVTSNPSMMKPCGLLSLLTASSRRQRVTRLRSVTELLPQDDLPGECPHAVRVLVEVAPPGWLSLSSG